MATQASSRGIFISNTIDNMKNKNCKAIKLRNRVVPSREMLVMRKKTSEGEENIEKEVEVEKEVGKKSEGEKIEKNNENEVRGDTFDKLIDRKSPWRRSK